MNYQSTIKRNSIFKKFVITLTFVFFAIFFLYAIRPLVFASLVESTGFFNQSVKNIRLHITEKELLQKQIEDLEERVRQQNVTAIFKKQGYQSDLLPAVADAYATSTRRFEGIQAPVIAKPPYTAYDSYVLSAGVRDGIQSQRLVVAQDIVAIGYTDTVSNRAARVRMFSQPGLETFVDIDGATYQATGRGGGTLFVRLPRSFADTQGQIVTLTGTDTVIIGQLVDTVFDPQDSFVSGFITIGANIYEQTRVLVSELSRPDVVSLEQELTVLKGDSQENIE